MTDKFPRTLYVETPLNPNEAYVAYTTLQGIPEDTILAVYRLVEVKQVHEEKRIVLIEAPTFAYEVIE